MKIHDVVQGSAEWHRLRAHIPTVSRFARILTPKTMEYSTQAKTYVAEIVAAKILDRRLDWSEDEGEQLIAGVDRDGNAWQARGRDLEPKAALWYQQHKDTDTEAVGFITTDDGRVGGSPDRLVGDEGGLEIKIRGAREHMKCLLGYAKAAEDTQVQGYLWLTDREWWDVLAFNPDLPSRLDRHYRNPVFMDGLTTALDSFYEDIAAAEHTLSMIDGDVLEGDNLIALLTASIRAKTTKDDGTGLDQDEIDELRRDLYAAKQARIITATEAHALLERSWRGDGGVRPEWERIQRALNLEPEPEPA